MLKISACIRLHVFFSFFWQLDAQKCSVKGVANWWRDGGRNQMAGDIYLHARSELARRVHTHACQDALLAGGWHLWLLDEIMREWMSEGDVSLTDSVYVCVYYMYLWSNKTYHRIAHVLRLTAFIRCRMYWIGIYKHTARENDTRLTSTKKD